MRVLHGDNQPQSRERLSELREDAQKKGLEVVGLAGKAIQMLEVKQAVESAGLFGADRLLILEDLFSGQSNKEKDGVIKYLREENPEMVIIWESKKIDGRRFKGFSADTQEFKVSSDVFRFLESVAPGQQNTFIPLWVEVSKTEAVELVFFLLVRQVRQLIQVMSEGEIFRGPSWLAGKLKHQGEMFGMEGLLNLHEQLYMMELGTKTGEGVLPLSARLEMLLVSI